MQARSTPVYHQFDFFVGNWDAFDLTSKTPSKVIAHKTVKIILDGCVVLENHSQKDGHHGESCSMPCGAHQSCGGCAVYSGPLSQ